MVEVQRIAKILGLPASIHSYAQLESKVSKRLPKKSLSRLALRIFVGRPEALVDCRQVVPRATVNRRRDRLSSIESETTSRIARVVVFAGLKQVPSKRADRVGIALESPNCAAFCATSEISAAV
jgi:uncharacterized protein (DUF2384 family)